MTAITGTTGITQDISTFFAKPYLSQSGSYALASAVGSTLTLVDILGTLLGNPIWSTKLAGTNHVRGTAVVTLKINASPFNAGALLLVFKPNYLDNAQVYNARTGLTQLTQLPHVKFDLSCDKEVSLRIPYVAPRSYCNIASGAHDWGRIALVVLTQFTGGASAPVSVPYNLWLHFEDFERQNAVAQSSGIRKGQRGSIVVSRGKNPTESELPPVSSILSSMSTITSSLSAIPVLSPLSGPTAWFLKACSGAASAFGWSKPLVTDFGNRITNGPHFGVPNSNGKDFSQPLSVFADNSVAVMSNLGSDGEDQMSINFLKTRWAYYSSYTLSYTDVATTSIATIDMAPRQFFSSYTIGLNGAVPVIAYRFTPVSFLANLFLQFRGSLELKFHFYKTQLHTGRVAICFTTATDAIGVPTFAQTANLHRTIVDLTDGNEVVINVPFTDVRMYLPTFNSIGKIYVFPINPLQGPVSIANFIEFTVEVRGGPDLEFAIPISTPIVPIVAQSGGGRDAIFGVEDCIICEDIGGSNIPRQTQDASLFCVGEKIDSLLQLMKRYTPTIPSPNILSSVFSLNTVVKFNPFYSGTAFITSPVLTIPGFGMDYVSLLSSLYLYSRGGVRWRVAAGYTDAQWSAWVVDNGVPGSDTITTSFSVTPDALPFRDRHSLTGKFYQKGNEGGIAVQFPSYSPEYTRFNRFYPTGSTFTSDSPQLNLAIELMGIAGNIVPQNVVLRAAADDYQCNYFIGIPEMYFDLIN
jgi:hypothetical protein